MTFIIAAWWSSKDLHYWPKPIWKRSCFLSLYYLITINWSENMNQADIWCIRLDDMALWPMFGLIMSYQPEHAVMAPSLSQLLHMQNVSYYCKIFNIIAVPIYLTWWLIFSLNILHLEINVFKKQHANYHHCHTHFDLLYIILFILQQHFSFF